MVRMDYDTWILGYIFNSMENGVRKLRQNSL